MYRAEQRSSYIIAAIDRVVHHSVILDMMSVESYRAKEANHQHLTNLFFQSQAMGVVAYVFLPFSGCATMQALLMHAHAFACK